MARRIPLVAAGVLHVLEPPGGPEIAVDSPAWAAWLRDPATRSFSFRGSSGAFTARKERRSGGGEYWSAYRKRGGKLRKVYLGKAEKLTLARLENAATVLAGHAEGKVTTADDAEHTRADDTDRETLTSSDNDARESSHQGPQGDSLLLTKLSIPTASPSLVTHLRLGERLEEELGHKLMLISAPAASHLQETPDFSNSRSIRSEGEARHHSNAVFLQVFGKPLRTPSKPPLPQSKPTNEGS
jgi:hypothetical protein